MSGETVDLRVDADDLGLILLARSLTDLHEIVSEVSANMLGRGRVAWVVDELTYNSPATVTVFPSAFHSDIEDEILASIPAAIETGLRTLQSTGNWPDYFSEKALERVRSLAARSSETVHIQMAPRGELIDLDSLVAANIDRLLAPSSVALGTVEGRLEGVSLHGATPEFSLYTHLEDRRVRCFFGSRVALEDIRQGIGRRVGVYGMMKVRDDGTVTSISAESIEVLPDQSELRDYRDARGMFRAI